MRALFIVCIVLIAGIAVSFLFYSRTTDAVIKDQEREISKLKREKAYLERVNKYLKDNREIVKVENITVNGDIDNIPSFKPW